MLDFARTRSRRCPQKRFDHLAPGENRMPMPTLIFGDDRPHPALRSLFEFRLESFNRVSLHWWPVHESNHGSVATAVQDLTQTGLQRTELPSRGIGIDCHRCAARKHDWGQFMLVLAHDH